MIPYFKAYIGKEELKEVTDVFNGGWLTTGKVNKEFEKSFLNTFNFTNHYATSVNSNTAGLHIVLDSFAFEKGKEVIVPSMTFTACAAAIAYSGLTPVIVDTNEDNLIDAAIIEENITDNTAAVMVVHFAGKTAEIDEINSLCGAKNIKVIEDCAHSLPSKYSDGTWVGSKGNPCIYSFYSNKTMTTGEGGMIISEDGDLNSIYLMKRSHGMNKNVLDRFTSASKKWEYDVDELGYKYNLTDIASAIGIAQLKKIFDARDLRSKIHYLYKENIDEELFWTTSNASNLGMHSHHLFQIRSKKDNNFRENLLSEFNKNNIGYSVHYKPLHMLSIWKNYAQDINHYTNSNNHFRSCISLPIYPEMPEDHVHEIISYINKIVFK